MGKLRFLFVAPQYLPTVGGVERYTDNLAKTLVQMGHAATVVTSALPGLPMEETDAAGVQVVRLPARLWLGGRFPAPKKNAAFKAAAKRLFGQGFDFAVVNTRFYLLSLWAAKQCRRRGIPFLVLDHSTGHLSMGSRFVDVFVRWYEHAAMWRMKRWCRTFYGVSLACNAWLRHFGVQAKGVLYNAVDVDRLAGLARQPVCDFRARLGLGADTPLVVFSGRFIKEKGVWELVVAHALLQQKLQHAVLVMAGDGPEWKAIQAQQTPGIVLTGPLSYEENMALLAQADVFCLPTYYAEGFPTAVLEAVALGTCVLTTPTGGSPELICDGESGILLKDRSPQALADALEKALHEREWRAKAEHLALEKLGRCFTWSSTAQHLVREAADIMENKEVCP